MEQIKDGIGRELRYVEYKLRKKRSDNKKKKNQNNVFGDPSNSAVSDQFKDSLPTNRGEEQIQVEVNYCEASFFNNCGFANCQSAGNLF